jgi:signal transduction histidine kinase
MSTEQGSGIQSPAEGHLTAPALSPDAGRLLPALIEVLAKSAEPRLVLPSVIGLILEATGADACFLHRWDPELRRLELVAANERYRHMVGKVRLAEGEGIAGWVARYRRPVVIERDKWSDPRYKYIPELGGDLYTSMVSVPVTSGRGGLIGVLNLHTVDQLHFGPSELEFISATAALVGTTLDNADLFGRIIEKESELEALVAATLEAQEAERARVAREIHDGVTQLLVALHYRLHAARSSPPAEVAGHIDKALALADSALEESRRAIQDLQPPALEDLGLVPSLRELAARAEGEGTVEIMVRTAEDIAVTPTVALVLYRVAQEALANVAKHAGATRATITVDAGPEVVWMVIEDDGTGFDVPEAFVVRPGASYGLAGMRERVETVRGSFRVLSRPDGGTRIDVRIPR